MTQELVVQLTEENKTLKNQNDQNQQGIRSLMAQLEASKQMLNESLATGLQLRTHLVLFQEQNKENNAKLEANQKAIDDLQRQLEDAKKNPAESKPVSAMAQKEPQPLLARKG